MDDKWIIKEKTNKETKKHLKELKEYVALFCNKEENKFELYKAIATPTQSFAILISSDIENVCIELNLICNKILSGVNNRRTIAENISTSGNALKI